MDKKNIKGLMKQFEDIMAASAFAEGGVFETAREILKGRQKVLLTLTGESSDRKSFKYAFNICKRIGAGLEILYINKNKEISELLEQFKDKLKKEGINYGIIQKGRCIKEAIIEHSEKEREILFVIVGAEPDLDIECDRYEKTLSEAWKKLKCPLVVVSKGEVPSMA